MAELLRGSLFVRAVGLVFAVAMFFGTGASALAQSRSASSAEIPIVLAMGPGGPGGEERSAPSLPRYFTINEVLAKLDTQKVNTTASNQPAQVAAINGSTPIATAMLPPQSIPSDNEPFGLATFRAPEGLLWVKWRKLITELQAEAQVLAQCQTDPQHCANPAARKFMALIEESRQLPGRAKIDRINRTINAAVRYATDQAQYGVPDLWTAPLATLASGQGDCEDYAIAKYVALRETGISVGDLRLLLVHDRVAHQDHAVVGVRENGRWLMLDNRHEVLIEHKDSWHFTPLFALDREGVKLFAAPYGTPPVGATARVATVPAKPADAVTSTDRDAATNLNAASDEAPALRLDTFESPTLRGRL